MKRSREEINMNPQFKRPLISTHRESYAQPQVPAVNGGTGGGGPVGGSGVGGNTPKLTTNDALSYLKEVKDMFLDKKDKYDMFLDVMKDFKAQRTDTAGVIARVKDLFKGHPNLILGFNTFLPKGYEITLNAEEEAPPKKTVEFEEAISFVNKIKKRFQNDDRVYKSFLDILNMYRKEHKGISEVYQEVEVLFEYHPDLLEEFTRFLPDNSASAPHASSGRHYQRHDERSSAIPSLRPAQMDKPRFRRDRIASPHGERDISVERPDTDDDKTTVRLHKEQKDRSERDNRDRRNNDQDFRESENENNGDMRTHRLAEKKKSTRKAEEFGAHPASVSLDNKDALKSMYSQEFCFCDRVKERLNNDDDYQAFLKCLHIYSTEIITRKELQGLVADLLGKYPDLMEGFNEVLERCEKIDGFLGVMSKKSLWNEGHGSKPIKSEDKEKEQKRDVEANKDKDRYKEKYWGKSIQELDLSDCERCTPSYRRLPEDYPLPSVSQRSELGEQVLNDHWVSVTSGSEDYSFKHMRRNQYEESLFRCEDDRFELDMLLESVSSTAKRVEEFLNATNDNSTAANSKPRFEDHFSALNLRCIERLYGDHGLDVMDILRRSPSVALPVILIRLKQKQEEWSRCRADFNKVWAEIYYKNHYKSLDHRSFYFKQQDSKNLSTKSLVTEIKEIKEKMLKEDDVILSVAAGSRRPIVPNLIFEYADVEVHEDLYKLIKYSSEEVCSTKEQVYKVMRLWSTFLEPMFGVPSRSHGSEITEDDLSTNRHVIRGSGTNVIETDGIPSADATTLLTHFKNSEAICNGNVNSSVQLPHSSRTNLTSIGAARLKENAITSGDRFTSSDAVAVAVTDGVIGHGVISLRPSHIGSMGEGHGAKSNTADMTSSEAGDASRSIPLGSSVFADVLANVPLGSGVFAKVLATLHNKDSFDPSKIEKEEGELSPTGDSEEDNFGVYQDGGQQSNTNNKNQILQFRNDRGEEACCLDAAVDNEADADDEESENVSAVGEDVSGSESAADECSREENEEEEDAEHDEVDAKGESEGEAEGISETHFVGGDGTSLPACERFLLIAKPIAKHIVSSSSVHRKQHSRIFYGNDNFYVLFRLHQMLYERLLSAKQYSTLSDVKTRNTKDADSDPYSRFLSALYSLLDGSSDNTKFEDDCRSIIGNQSYVLFTLDKLLYKLVKQLQAISSDELDNKLLQLHEYEESRKPENFVDSVYYENSHVLLYEENIYRFESKSSPGLLSIQLMDDGSDKSDVVAVSVDPNFATYLHEDYLSAGPTKNESPAVMLKRNRRKFIGNDEDSATCKALENVRLWNGLECKMASTSSKIYYVLDTEDFFIRRGRKTRMTARYTDSHRSKVAKFTQHWKAVLQSRS